MTCFDSQMIQLRKEILLSQTLDVPSDKFLVRKDSTRDLLSEAYILSLSDNTELVLYEIYYTLVKRFPRFISEIKHPVFFRSKLRTIHFDKYLWKLLNHEDS